MILPTMPIPDAVLIKNKKLEQNPLAPKREKLIVYIL